MTLEARGTESWGEEEKESVAMEGADRAKGNRSTYPHLHVFLSRVWRKRIGEYVSMSPEHKRTALEEAYGRSASCSQELQVGVGHTSPVMCSWKEYREAQ